MWDALLGFLSCFTRIYVISITENGTLWLQLTTFLVVPSGGGARDLLQDRMWTLLLLLQANATSSICTARYPFWFICR